MGRLVVSQNELLLLHLAELDRHRDDAEVPLGASQEGIAQRLQMQVHSASRALASLEEEGLVADRLAHVRGAPKRRRAYFLTERGRQAARTIKEGLSKQRVVLELQDGALELTLDETTRRLAGLLGITPSVVDIVEASKSSGVVRPGDLGKVKPEPALVGRPFVQRSHGRPRVEGFWGRDQESERISKALSGDSVSTVLIWGMPGIGKSTLGSKLYDNLLGKRSAFWYTFGEWDTEGSFLPPLAEFLASDGKTNTISWFKSGRPLGEGYLPLTKDLGAMDAVFFFDDIQKPMKQVSGILSMITEAAQGSKSAKIVLVSREIPGFFSKLDRSSLAIELSGLDRDAAWRMAESLKSPDAVRVVEESRGHPLLISLMARSGVAQAKGDVVSFIEREVYGAVSEPERRILEILSIFRHPVPLDAVPGPYESVSKLRKRALVSESEDGISTHDLFRDFFRSRMTAQLKTSIHLEAAGYCETRPEVEWKLESLYHYVEAGDWTRATKVVLGSAHDLSEDFPEETLELVSRLPVQSSADGRPAEMLFLRGQLHESLGSQEEALADFEQSLALLQSEKDSTARGLVLEAVARLQSRIERWSESMAAHEKALQLYEKTGDREAQAREWMNIGGVQRRKGDYPRAREAYSKAMEISTKEEDRAAQAACLNNLGLLDRDEGKLKDAEARLKESSRLAHAVKDDAGEARALENLADLLKIQVRFEEMTSLLLQSSEAYRRAGEIEEYKRVLATCAETLGAQGRWSEGIELVQHALDRPGSRRRAGLFQKTPKSDMGDVALSSALIDLLRESGDLRRARTELTRYISIAESMSNKDVLARGMLLHAIIDEDAGDLEASVRSLTDAAKTLNEQGNSEGLIAVHMRWGNIEEKRGDPDSAEKHYSEAARYSELAGDRRAFSLAMDNLHAVSRGEKG